MQHRMRHQQHPPTEQDPWNWKPWQPRACGRRAVALRVDYATADGRAWLALLRNLSLQGMFIDRADADFVRLPCPSHKRHVPCLSAAIPRAYIHYYFSSFL